MNIFSLITAIILVGLLLFITFKKHIFKLKNYSYNIGSSFKKNELIYYISYQPKHGVYLRAKKLKNKYKFFIKKEVLNLMTATFKDPDEAENALLAFLEKLKSL
ncbi:hypothetical protein ACFLRU_05165 [Bacteroidota bacterium]